LSVIVSLEDPATYEYVPEEVRRNLERCVRTREVVKFPFVRHCVCDGQAGGRMVACDACDRWHRVRCVADSYISKSDTWFCSACK